MHIDDVEKQICELKAARAARPRCIRAFESVEGLLDRGRQHLQAHQEIVALARGEDRSLLDLAATFFMNSSIAHLEMAALHAAKLTDKHRDSIGLEYLLNLFEKEGSRLFPGEWEGIKALIQKGRSRILELQPVIEDIKRRRDQDLAHLDRLYVNTDKDGPDAIRGQKLNELFEVTRSILDQLRESCVALQELGPPLSRIMKDLLGPPGLEDLIRFARIAFESDLVRDPSENAQRIRDWFKVMRAVESEQDALD